MTEDEMVGWHSRLFAFKSCVFTGASLVAQTVKNLPAMWETWIYFVGQEDPLEKKTATHCSILAWKIPCIEEPSGLQSMGSQSRTPLSTHADAGGR